MALHALGVDSVSHGGMVKASQAASTTISPNAPSTRLIRAVCAVACRSDSPIRGAGRMAQPVHTRPHMAQRARELIPQISGADLEPREEEVVGADYTQLVAGRDGSIEEGKRHGLFDFDTRILSRHRLT